MEDNHETRMEAWINRLKELQSEKGDIEAQHSYADEILCEVLNYLGCTHLVSEWEKVHKWYA